MSIEKVGFENMWKEEIVKEACRKFEGDDNSIRLIGGKYQHVFEFTRNNEPCILKLFPIAVKDQKILELELHWMSYLRDKKIKIPKTIPSINGNVIEAVPILPLPFCAVAFEKAEGEKIDLNKTIFGNNHFFRMYGQLLGQLHFLARRSQHEYPLFDQWNEGEFYQRDFSLVDNHLLNKLYMYIEQIESFPKTTDSYGLIHNDLHLNNFLITKNKEFVLYDFSKTKYHWYTYDIAITITHIIESYNPEDKQQFLEHCLLAFMEGYLAESSLEEGWEEQIQFFLDFYEVVREIEKMSRYDLIHTQKSS